MNGGTLTSGNLVKSDANQNTVDAGVSIGTVTNGKVCEATSSTSIACTASASGTGTVTSVTVASPNTTLQSVGGTNPVTTAGTINLDINWSDLNTIRTLSAGAGLNWQDISKINTTSLNWNNNLFNNIGINWSNFKDIGSQTANWYDIALITNTLNTVASGVGNIKLYDSTGTNWADIQAASTIPSSTTWTLPSADGTNGQFLKTNGSGSLSFATASGSGTVNSGTSGQLSYYASSTNAVSSLIDSAYNTTTGLDLTQNSASAYGLTTVNNNSAALAVNLVENDQGYKGGITETGSGFGITNAFGVGSFDSHVVDFLINESPVAQFDTGGDFGVGITNTSYYNYETGQQMIDVNNQEFQANFVSTNGTYGGGISIGQDTGSAVVNGARIGKIEFSGPTDSTGFGGNAYSSAGIAAYATQNWSGSATGSQLVLQTTPNSSTTRTTVLTLGQSGSMTLANASAHAGQATCWTTSGQIGYCTTVVSSGGACTCTGL